MAGQASLHNVYPGSTDRGKLNFVFPKPFGDGGIK